MLQNGVDPLQALPQAPQLAGSEERLVHVVPHFVWPAGQAVPVQAPLIQFGVDPPQTRPHAPQLLASLLRSAQRPPQQVWPLEPQLFPQAPQFGSDDRLAQVYDPQLPHRRRGSLPHDRQAARH